MHMRFPGQKQCVSRADTWQSREPKIVAVTGWEMLLKKRSTTVGERFYMFAPATKHFCITFWKSVCHCDTDELVFLSFRISPVGIHSTKSQKILYPSETPQASSAQSKSCHHLKQASMFFPSKIRFACTATLYTLLMWKLTEYKKRVICVQQFVQPSWISWWPPVEESEPRISARAWFLRRPTSTNEVVQVEKTGTIFLESRWRIQMIEEWRSEACCVYMYIWHWRSAQWMANDIGIGLNWHSYKIMRKCRFNLSR